MIYIIILILFRLQFYKIFLIVKDTLTQLRVLRKWHIFRRKIHRFALQAATLSYAFYFATTWNDIQHDHALLNSNTPDYARAIYSSLFVYEQFEWLNYCM